MRRPIWFGFVNSVIVGCFSSRTPAIGPNCIKGRRNILICRTVMRSFVGARFFLLRMREAINEYETFYLLMYNLVLPFLSRTSLDAYMSVFSYFSNIYIWNYIYNNMILKWPALNSMLKIFCNTKSSSNRMRSELIVICYTFISVCWKLKLCGSLNFRYLQ